MQYIASRRQYGYIAVVDIKFTFSAIPSGNDEIPLFKDFLAQVLH